MWGCFLFSLPMHNDFFKKNFPKHFSWSSRHLPQLTQGHCLTKLIFLGTEDSHCQSEGPVSALLGLFFVRCLLSVWQTSLDSWWLPYDLCGVKLNMLSVCLVGECRASGADFGILLFPNPQNCTLAASFQQQQLLNLHHIQVKCLPGVVN